MHHFYKLQAIFIFVLTLASIGHSQTMAIAPSGTTGLDVHLSSSSYNYTYYPGASVWGHLGSDGYVEYSVAAAPGLYRVQVYYSNGTQNNGSIRAVVNGAQQGSISIPSTGAWSRFQMSGTTNVNLGSGQSTLRLAAADQLQAYNLAGITVTPVSLLSAAAPASNNTNPLLGSSFYVNPYSLAANNSWMGCQNGLCISKIASQPQGVWFGDWNWNPQGDVATVMSNAAVKGTVPVIVVYNLPHRDCGGYSSGGAANAQAYQDWVQKLSLGIGSGKAAVILEPDGLTQYNTANCLNDSQKSERLALFQFAISQFAQHAPNAAVYFDAGPPNGIRPDVMGQTLIYAGVSRAAGFAVNVSNYESTADSTSYGNAISSVTGGKHFIIDTSRNGRGATWDHQFCNPSDRGLGLPPQPVSGGLVDAYLWVQNPGTSDGNCNGNVPAGSFSSNLAWTLIRNSSF